ncbi:DUF4169 family protein [Mesorhizobium sp. VNQ89]|uniref:DUF4169 family protein n=1 Tax=Mesorhizobium quangtriensis TaxID=3157709 RepID=UPI0032B7BEF5
MSNVVNLRLARKRKERAEKEAVAAENRTLHGRSKAERQLDLARKNKAEAFIEAHRLDQTDLNKP